MSGTSPHHAFTVPESLGGQDCRIEVEKTTLDALRAQIPVSHDEAMRWVDDGFALEARTVYKSLDSPALEPASGWNIFRQMVALL